MRMKVPQIINTVRRGTSKGLAGFMVNDVLDVVEIPTHLALVNRVLKRNRPNAQKFGIVLK